MKDTAEVYELREPADLFNSEDLTLSFSDSLCELLPSSEAGNFATSISVVKRAIGFISLSLSPFSFLLSLSFLSGAPAGGDFLSS